MLQPRHRPLPINPGYFIKSMNTLPLYSVLKFAACINKLIVDITWK